MVFFNYATMQMAAKIVYYGPGLCGKTTNLHVIYGRTAPSSRGEMVSLETETDRTLFFDLLPLDVGTIGGFKTRLQLYTVPGQVFYNTTRKLVLKGIDGVVFVADSQRPMLDPNLDSLRNLKENLAEIGIAYEEIPKVFQFNKRDLPGVLSVDELNAALNPDRSIEFHEASAKNGAGVFETLKAISKLTLRSLRSKISGDASTARRPAVVASPATPGPVPALTPPAQRPAPAPPPPPPPPATADELRAALSAPDAPKAKGPESTMQRLDRFAQFTASVTPARKPASSTSIPAVVPPPAFRPDAPPPRPASEASTAQVPAYRPEHEPVAEISFGEGSSTALAAVDETSVKHVRVRSNVDILSELDKLRKVATQKPAAAAAPLSGLRLKPAPGSIDDLLSSGLNHKRDVSKSFDVGMARSALGKSRVVTVALRFQDESGRLVEPERTFEIDLANARDLLRLGLALRFNVEAE